MGFLPPGKRPKPAFTAHLAPVSWYQQGEEFQRSAVLVNFRRSQKKYTIEKIFASVFPGTDPASYKVKCKEGSDNARLLFLSKTECQQFVETCTDRMGFFDTRQIIRSQCASPPRFLARQARPFDTRQTAKPLASSLEGRRLPKLPPSTFNTQLVSLRHPGSPCRFSKWSWNTVSMSLKCMSDEELHQLVTAASAANRSAVVLFFSPSRAPPHLRPCVVGVY